MNRHCFALTILATAATSLLAQEPTKWMGKPIASMTEAELREALVKATKALGELGGEYDSLQDELFDQGLAAQRSIMPLSVPRKLTGEQKETMLRSKEVLHLLRYFTTPGRWQPGDLVVDEAKPKSPMSYSRIKAQGALEPTHRGLSRMISLINFGGLQVSKDGPYHKVLPQLPRYYVANEFDIRRHIDRDRPKFQDEKLFVRAQDYYAFSVDEMVSLRRIQRMLIELGPTMVELGMLAP